MNGIEFPKAAEKEWRKAAEKLLKGKPFDATLSTPTAEGITLDPIYFNSREINLKQNHDFYIAQTLFRNNDQFNKKAREVLQLGQSALNINLDQSSQLRGSYPSSAHTIQIKKYSDFKKLFKEIDLKHIPLFFNGLVSADKLYTFYRQFLDENNIDPAYPQIALGADPLSAALIYGGFENPSNHILDDLYAIVKDQQKHPQLDVFTIRADIIHNSGGHKVQQLTYILALLAHYISHFTEKGIDPAQIFSTIRVKMAVGNTQFGEIAKLRALHLLVQNMAKAFGLKKAKLKIDVVTSWRWLSPQDVYNNMIRASGQVFAALVAGCDSIEVLPFNLSLKAPDEFALRQARNLPIILLHEAHLNKVMDAASGSYYLDSLSLEMAQKSWHAFQHIEKQGGIMKAMQAGSWQTSIHENAQRQHSEIDNDSKKIIGVNCYKSEQEVEATEKNDFYYNQQKLFAGIEPLQLKRII